MRHLLSIYGRLLTIAITVGLTQVSCNHAADIQLKLDTDDHILLIGNNLCSRMMDFNHFETELHLRYPDQQLYVRNICDPGNFAGFRAHSGRTEPWAFPFSNTYYTDLARNSNSEGVFPSPDQWLGDLDPDVVLAFFGFGESFQGESDVERFQRELSAYIDHFESLMGGEDGSKLVLISPTAATESPVEGMQIDVGILNNNIEAFSKAMRDVAREKNVAYVDLFGPSKSWHRSKSLTIDGYQLNDQGYQKLSTYLADRIFEGKRANDIEYEQLREAVADKNWYWHNDFKIPNGVHVFGRRYEPFGPDNYPYERTKIMQLTSNRDQAIWAICQGQPFDLAAADAATETLPEVETNFEFDPKSPPRYLYGKEALESFSMADGYEINLFASEKEFPDLANPVQISFDNKGRLWVAVMPTYPHWKPGDPKPNDKLIILEDTNGDGRADQQTTFAENLHLPIGFEFAPEGVYLSQAPHLKLLADTDGDDKADYEEIIYSGFDDHDTHHAISAFCADPSGAIYMAEGIFLHTNVETPYGLVRATNGGFYRFEPRTRKLERSVQLLIPNPWGIAFDEWGQNFFAETSGPDVIWMAPTSIKPMYGVFSPNSRNLIDSAHRVRPTSGLEFVSSHHFPAEVQGDMLINNTIGFLGTKQHQMHDEEAGYKSTFRQDLVRSSDPNFRPVDMEFAPDGSLYLADWHNVLIGHMQHNARDPLRDHVHGRIYRISYPDRPLSEVKDLTQASIDELLAYLETGTYRDRYRARRELRGRDANEVLQSLNQWEAQLDANTPNYDQLILEGLWLTWGMQKLDLKLLDQVCQSTDFRVRAAGMKVLRYAWEQVPNHAALFMAAANDESSRVRLEAIVTASWLNEALGNQILDAAETHEVDSWMEEPLIASRAHLNGEAYQRQVEESPPPAHLEEADAARFLVGREIYHREGHCGTCHQSNGKGLIASGYPTLSGTPWTTGDKERLIKITLHGIYGPMDVAGTHFVGQVPMTPFKGLLTDEEIAGVLTFVRNSFGNQASPVTPAEVKEVRDQTADRNGFYTAEELLATSPLEQLQ